MMDEFLLDVSWTLYYVPTNSAVFQNLFKPSIDLEQYQNKLTTFLNTSGPSLRDDFDNEHERLGVLQDVQWRHRGSTRSSTTAARPISITVIYAKQTFKYHLFSNSLLLMKSSPAHIKRFHNFLTDGFDVSIDVLKLPPEILQSLLRDYIDTLVAPFSPPGEDDEPSRIAILKTAIGNLRITIAFSSTVAPQMKTLDIDVPFDTVHTLLQSRPVPGGEGNSVSDQFLDKLAYHVTEQTGLVLPLKIGEAVSQSPMWISRMTSAAFAVSTEGKLKFSSRASEGTFEDVIIKANNDILDRVNEEAISRVASNGG